MEMLPKSHTWRRRFQQIQYKAHKTKQNNLLIDQINFQSYTVFDTLTALPRNQLATKFHIVHILHRTNHNHPTLYSKQIVKNSNKVFVFQTKGQNTHHDYTKTKNLNEVVKLTKTKQFLINC